MQILKTIVYCDRISDVLLIARQLRRWMRVENAKQIVVPYYSELSEETKGRVSQEFVRSESIHRIIVATDAMGMGINNPDLIRVVNWKQPFSRCALMQRAGRAARSPTLNGDFIWFVKS
jgi:superfamily II DNA helicase RecQ